MHRTWGRGQLAPSGGGRAPERGEPDTARTPIEVPPDWEERLTAALRHSARDPAHPLSVFHVNIQQMEGERRQALLAPVLWGGLALWFWRYRRRGPYAAAAVAASARAAAALSGRIPRVRALSAALTVARDQLQQQIARQVEDTGSAIRMLERWGSELFPYALVLGNFTLQADSSLDSESLSLFVSPLRRRVARMPVISRIWRQRGYASWTMTGAPGLASRLATALDGRAHVVTVTNASSLSSEPTPNLGRLVVPDTDWLGYVVNLAKQCSLAVFDLSETSPGVRAELEALADPQLAKRTVIVWPDPDRVEKAANAELAGRLMAGLPPKMRLPLAPDDPLLAPFTRQVRETELDFEDLDATAVVADLLERVDQLRSSSPEGRRKRMRADELFARVRGLLEDEGFDEILAVLPEMRSLYSDIGMESRIAEADLLLGFIEATRDNRESALSAWRAALERLASLDQDERARLISGYEITLQAFYEYGEEDDRERIATVLGGG